MIDHPEVQRLTRVFSAIPVGQTLIYHVGNLATDAQKRPDLQAVRAFAMSLRERRLGRLSQRRVAEDAYEYRITKSAPPTATTDEA